ncbi:MAG: hypothetical protein N838_09770 [Thiohalocapsa sp. PB-PSB1]|nr:MAG: hypothetical protein N838_09770 [Thiohalocapsa sp. PB-PSB1]
MDTDHFRPGVACAGSEHAVHRNTRCQATASLTVKPIRHYPAVCATMTGVLVVVAAAGVGDASGHANSGPGLRSADKPKGVDY